MPAVSIVPNAMVFWNDESDFVDLSNVGAPDWDVMFVCDSSVVDTLVIRKDNESNAKVRASLFDTTLNLYDVVGDGRLHFVAHDVTIYTSGGELGYGYADVTYSTNLNTIVQFRSVDCPYTITWSGHPDPIPRPAHNPEPASLVLLTLGGIIVRKYA
jgi:hypothetical protein